ncbi:phosphotransferase [Microbacterium excoecariae]|uniref:phosphotransferase n=1 Tax=Microbacterium excoecariae TaxID=2715210 RepID=UPI00140D6EC1|nr:phosphotransferase [Microbacterium excoecariae]NHI16917.1 phosphotransferase [Microbacterium excoecariae]
MSEDAADLARRDRAIPALADALDAAGLAARAGAASAEVTYRRYKPGVSLDVGLVLVAADGVRTPARAVAYGAESAPKLRRDARRGALAVDTARGFGILPDEADRDLPGIAVARRAHPAVRVLVYKPGRRWVGRCDACAVIVKVHRPAASRAASAGHALLADLTATAAEGHTDLDRGILETDLLPGRAPGSGDADALRAAGRALARIHTRGAEAPAAAGVAWRRARRAALDGALAQLRAVAPAAGESARAVARQLAEEIARPRAIAPIHGDFSRDQLLVSGGDVAIVDLDRAGFGDPLWDLASAAADSLEGGGDGLPALADGYRAAGGKVDPAAFRALTAAALLQRAAEPFRRGADDWRDRAVDTVALAARLVAPVPRDPALPGLAVVLERPGAVLVAHREGKRAVVRLPGRDPAFVKVVRPKRHAAALDRARRVEGLRVARAPRIIGADAGRGTIEMTAVGERTLFEAGADPSVPIGDLARWWSGAGRAVGELLGIRGDGLDRHGPREELAALDRAWAHARGAEGADRAAGLRARVAAELLGAPGPEDAVLHRDLHDKQLLVPREGERVGLIDVDTLARGEAALDVANLAVHIELRRAQGHLTPERADAARAAFLREVHVAPRRFAAYARATALRLAAVYAVRESEGHAARAMLALAAGDDPSRMPRMGA